MEMLARAPRRPSSAWAVGDYFGPAGAQHPLAEHWNGTAWTPVPSPNAPHAADSSLAAVTAISARDAWAVGWSASGIASGLLIEHWNGKAWAIVPVHRARTTPPRR